ncbi:C-type lectin domain family 17, member A-like [Saccostrea cucullata]|uniref:C-type lectin domain family 17, member A-like n=1 Tax=Saccostrea cuccullata TaxID=36930 RepID=UPI002ED2B90D
MQFNYILGFAAVLWGFEGVNCVGCQPGWNQFQNKCYWFSHTTRPWGEAEAICLGFQSKLAEPRTHAESAYLISHFQSLHDARFYWIGISDLIEEDRWIYSSDQQPIAVNDFYPGEPNQHTDANCAALWDTGHGKWADEPCGHVFRFVCEAEFDEGGDILG